MNGMSEEADDVEATGDYAYVPPNGDWRVPMVYGSEKGGWRGHCHVMVAWRIAPGEDVATPIYGSSGKYIDEEDMLGDPHPAEEWCCNKDEELLGGSRVGERMMCTAMREALMNARVQEEMARRRAAEPAS
jgi:hypothetical protein